METIQVVLDAKLLKAADNEAKRQRVNRSELKRQAIREHLARLRTLDLEDRDRRGYEAQPQRADECRGWEEAAAWPEGETVGKSTSADFRCRISRDH
jgi:Arc/MetJ-type ribon-helix-helix transcriptional regulator